MIGIDIVEVSRIESAVRREHFLLRVFTQNEIDYYHGSGNDCKSLAGMWCVKEAVAKALGTGVIFALTDIETVHEDGGKPRAVLYGKAKQLLGDRHVEISISHTESTATAVALICGGK